MIAVRPREYFPGLAYFALMLRVDRFVLADTFQYSRQSFQNRARIRNPQGWQWISVPLKGGQHGRPIRDVRIRRSVVWRPKHWKALQFNYRSSPYFEFYEPEFARIFREEWEFLGDLTCATVSLVHRLLDLPATLVRASELVGPPETLPDVLCAAGDEDLIVPAVSAAHDASLVPNLSVVRFEHPAYRQVFEGFEPGMSVVDLLFNYGPESRAILQESVDLEERAP